MLKWAYPPLKYSSHPMTAYFFFFLLTRYTQTDWLSQYPPIAFQGRGEKYTNFYGAYLHDNNDVCL